MTLGELYDDLEMIAERFSDEVEYDDASILAADATLCYFMHALEQAMDGKQDPLLNLTLAIGIVSSREKS